MTLKVLEYSIDELSDGLTFMYFVEDELSDRSLRGFAKESLRVFVKESLQQFSRFLEIVHSPPTFANPHQDINRFIP